MFTRQDYFVYNGETYYTGTVLSLRRVNKFGHTGNVQATFLSYTPENGYITLKIENTVEASPLSSVSKEIVEVLSRGSPNSATKQVQRKASFDDELCVDGLFFAWMWYAFIMIVAFVFNDRIGIWILASVLFFSYRNEKLRKAGYK